MSAFALNRDRVARPDWGARSFLGDGDMLAFHRTLDGYEATPLVLLQDLATRLNIGQILVKDESRRFGIKAFKALGASYAIYRHLGAQWHDRFSDTPFGPQTFRDSSALRRLGRTTFCAATDGNHGRAVAWTARRLDQDAVIYMPEDSAPARVANIEGEGARVVLVKGTFDDCVRHCASDAATNGWQAISDTAYPGYFEIPQWILLGYTSLFTELEDTINVAGKPHIDIVILPAGVGGLAAAGCAYYARRYGDKRPRLACVEPVEAACFLESVQAGKMTSASGTRQTIMAGLSCGEPSAVAWPIIRDCMDLFLAVEDHYAEEAMREYAHAGVVSGESGAAGLAALLALRGESGLRPAAAALDLGPESRVLLINTEGDTDPEGYQRVVGRAAENVR